MRAADEKLIINEVGPYRAHGSTVFFTCTYAIVIDGVTVLQLYIIVGMAPDRIKLNHNNISSS